MMMMMIIIIIIIMFRARFVSRIYHLFMPWLVILLLLLFMQFSSTCIGCKGLQ